MEVTRQRSEEIAGGLFNIRFQLRKIETDELQTIIADARREEAIGPLLDPTKWRDQDLFSSVRKTIGVLELIIKLKEALE